VVALGKIIIIINVEFELFVMSHFTTNAQNALHLNQCRENMSDQDGQLPCKGPDAVVKGVTDIQNAFMKHVFICNFG
jgi:hypothetical protein